MKSAARAALFNIKSAARLLSLKALQSCCTLAVLLHFELSAASKNERKRDEKCKAALHEHYVYVHLSVLVFIIVGGYSLQL